MKWTRASGVLVHPTSFPSAHGIGDLGPGAITLLDFLAASGQRLWQILPLGPTGYGNSPYASRSAFAGNPLLISPERLVEEDMLPASALGDTPEFPADHVDYERVAPWKYILLRRAYEHFQRHAPPEMREAFEAFRAAEDAWLGDYALFMALKQAHDGRAWTEWSAPYVTREPDALAQARRELADEIAFETFTQFVFFRQWSAVRQAARERSISIVGDVAIFVAHDSADVWARRELFSLDDAGNPTVVAGVPPDYFSATGQRWGNPLYRWDVLEETGYAWWIERIRKALDVEDYIRLDHFRGFEAYWEIPGKSETAVEGRWVAGPSKKLFDAIQAALGEVPFIAEDLGLITPEVRVLRRELGFPGMKVLQFAFGSGPENNDLPHHFTHNAIVYTGTHDNDTSRGWFESRDGNERTYALQYLATDPEQVVWAMIRAALASVANLAVVPLQDLLDLGREARMNFPSRADGNWRWRVQADQLTETLAARLAALTATYGR